MASAAIRLHLDAGQVLFFATRLPKVLGYASQEGLNATIKSVQGAVFRRVRAKLQIRDERLFFGTDKKVGGVAGRITAFASYRDARPYAEIEAGTLSRTVRASDRHRRLLFSYFEDGGTRKPFTPGAKHVAEPVRGAARPDWASKVLPQFTFAKMGLRKFAKSPGTKQRKLSRKGAPLPLPEKATFQLKGKLGTFVLFTPRLPHGGVYQRNPADKSAKPRLLWAYDEPFPIKGDLEWLRTARAEAQKYFSQEIDARIQERMDHETAKAASHR